MSRYRMADAVAIGLALGYGALMVTIGDATAPGAAVPWPVDVAIGVICAGALPLRRRWPLALALVLVPFGAVSVMATGAIVIALFALALCCRAPVVLLIAAANVATGTVYFLIQDNPPYPFWLDIVLRGVVSAAITGWGLYVQAHSRLTRSLRERAAQLVAEQQFRVDHARRTERARIAREMHDALAHRISLVSLYAGALEVRTDAQPQELSAAATAIRTSAHEALQELRAVIGVLREGAPGGPEPPQPHLPDVPGLIDSARAHGMTVHYTCSVPEPGPPPLLGRTAYRLVQEGLTNAGKHAPGAPADVLIDGAAGADLHIRITNPCPTPVPAPTVPGAGMGLLGVEERVALARGRVEYGATGDRFRLEAWLPWRA